MYVYAIKLLQIIHFGAIIITENKFLKQNKLVINNILNSSKRIKMIKIKNYLRQKKKKKCFFDATL